MFAFTFAPKLLHNGHSLDNFNIAQHNTGGTFVLDCLLPAHDIFVRMSEGRQPVPQPSHHLILLLLSPYFTTFRHFRINNNKSLLPDITIGGSNIFPNIFFSNFLSQRCKYSRHVLARHLRPQPVSRVHQILSQQPGRGCRV